MRTIVIDAGHGGSDPGAVNGTRLEKNDTLNLALAVQRRLQAQGQNVVMTRNTDVFIPLAERSAISNRAHADMFVSIHRNAASSSAANGVENFVYLNPTAMETQYAQTVLNAVVSAGVQNNRGVKRGNFAVLRNTRAPAMLLEMGFISNERDNQLFDQNFDAYADAITRGIIQALGETYHPPAHPSFSNYTVVAGDTLFRLAQKFGTTVEAIMSLNGLANSNLSIGQVLRIPAKLPSYFNYTVVAGDTLWRIAKKFGTSVEEVVALNGLNSSNLVIWQVLKIPTTSPLFVNYTVVAGDTLFRLARHFGTTVEAIMKLNGLANSHLSIGQTLKIPT